jgi:formylglycine-generating enzyme required for sulfatase activity
LSIQLSQPDFQRLTQIIQKLPDFANVRDRRRLVAAAFEGVPKADVILSQLDLDGTPKAVSEEVVLFLCRFGQIDDGKEPIWVFLDYILPVTSDEDTAFIQNLFQNYPSNKPDSSSHLINRNPLTILDRIATGSYTEADLEELRQILTPNRDRNVVQLGKYNVNIGQGQGDIHIGDRTYYGADAESIKAVIRELWPELIRSIGIEKLPQQSSQIFLPSNLSSQTTDQNVVTTTNSEKLLFPSPAKPAIATFEFEVVTVDVEGRENKRSRKQAEYFIENLGVGVVLEMVSIPEGKFKMGASQDEKSSQEDERPQHIVNIKPFFIGRYPITQAQWKIVANFPKIYSDLQPEPSYFKGDNLPVERVSWHDAQEFCQRLTQKTGQKYRLPSEAEWEYTCRARTSTPFYFGKTITENLVNYCGQNGDINGVYRQQTTEVGSFPPNAFGLCDMHGLVWEWCADYEHEDYQSAPSDGSAWLSDGNEEYRILRGGSWDSSGSLCRSASRFSENSTITDKEFGFRVVCSFT